MARRYVAATVIDRRAIAAAAGWAALGAVVVGAAAHVLARFLFPVELILPAAIGVAVGGAVARSVRRVRLSLFRCPAGHDDGAVLRVAEVVWTRHRRLALRRVADLEVTGGEVVVVAAGVGAEVEAR